MRRLLLFGTLLIGFAPAAFADAETGWRYYLAGDYAAAVEKIRPLAEVGDSQAQYYMGTLSEHGVDSGRKERRSFDRALSWYERAAAQGHTGAKFSLGMLYYHGAGEGAVAPDDERAAPALLAAAKAGYPMAQHLIGHMYRVGRGVPRDLALAQEWNWLAAQRGVAGAQFELGLLIAKRPHDRAERIASYAWFLLAARAAHPGALENLNALAPTMLKADIERAASLAEAWRPNTEPWPGG